MPVPRGSLNARIVRIERQVRGYGGDRKTGKVLLRDVDANRQPLVRLLIEGVGDRETRGDTEFYFDLPVPPKSAFDLRVGDFVTWRRLVDGEPSGDEFVSAVRVVEVNDNPVRLSHVRVETRGGDGSGA